MQHSNALGFRLFPRHSTVVLDNPGTFVEEGAPIFCVPFCAFGMTVAVECVRAINAKTADRCSVSQ